MKGKDTPLCGSCVKLQCSSGYEPWRCSATGSKMFMKHFVERCEHYKMAGRPSKVMLLEWSKCCRYCIFVSVNVFKEGGDCWCDEFHHTTISTAVCSEFKEHDRNSIYSVADFMKTRMVDKPVNKDPEFTSRFRRS